METVILILILLVCLYLTIRYILRVIKGNGACDAGCAETYGKSCEDLCPQKELHEEESTIPLEQLFSDRKKTK